MAGKVIQYNEYEFSSLLTKANPIMEPKRNESLESVSSGGTGNCSSSSRLFPPIDSARLPGYDNPFGMGVGPGPHRAELGGSREGAE